MLRALNLCAAIVAFFMLAFYLMPATIWSRFSPLSATPLFEYGGYTRAHGILAAIVSLGAIGSFAPYLRSRVGASSLAALTAIYLVASIGPCVWGGDIHVLTRCTLVLLSLGTGLLAARICTNPLTIARVLCLIGALQAGYAVVDYMHRHHVMLSGSIIRAGGTFDQPNALSLVMVICLPIAVALAMAEERTWLLAINSACVAFISAALMLTWSRGAIFAAGLALVWIVHRTSRKRAVTALAALVLLGLCSLPALIRTSGIVNQVSSEGSTAGRLGLWKLGWGVFTHHWLTGVGAGALEIPVQVKYGGGMTLDVFMEPKNLALHWLDEFGLAGGVLLLLFIVTVGRSLTSRRSIIGAGVGGAWLAVLAAGVFDTPFGVSNREYGNVLAGALLGLTFLLAPAQNAEAFEAPLEDVETTSGLEAVRTTAS